MIDHAIALFHHYPFPVNLAFAVGVLWEVWT